MNLLNTSMRPITGNGITGQFHLLFCMYPPALLARSRSFAVKHPENFVNDGLTFLGE
jgi:hypothetical protein